MTFPAKHIPHMNAVGWDERTCKQEHQRVRHVVADGERPAAVAFLAGGQEVVVALAGISRVWVLNPTELSRRRPKVLRFRQFQPLLLFR
jgi:hypothetical protein